MTDAETETDVERWIEGLRAADILFVREYLLDLNAKQAMIRCGHTESTAIKNGHRMVRRPAIRKAILAAMSERAEKLHIGAQTVLAEAFSCYLRCVEDGNWAQAHKFLEMVGRHVNVGAFQDRVDHSSTDGSMIPRTLAEFYGAMHPPEICLPDEGETIQ